MNKVPRLSKSGIEYLDYMWGIWSGCRNQQNGICPVKRCWAKGIALHFPKLYPKGFEPTFYIEAIDSPKYLKKPSRIGVGWVGDVIGYCDHVSEYSMILQTIMQCPQHIFVFLTKNGEKLLKWHFPDNCWVGISATNSRDAINAIHWLGKISAKVKFISYEPLFEATMVGYRPLWWAEQYKKNGINLIIIGQQTPISAKTQPKIEWVEEIVHIASKAHIPIFLKENLMALLPCREPFWTPVYWYEYDKGAKVQMCENRLRQELPK
jgi:hypothetical protein